MTRSYFVGSQKYSFAWSGDNTADYSHLRNSIALVLSNSISGMVYFGCDVGGFFDNSPANLMRQWHQVGAWCYPFFRNHCHHEYNEREINVLDGPNQKLAIEAVHERYQMLPYWYLLSRISNLTGQPIVRPIWWHFPDQNLIDLDTALLLGENLLLVPFLDEVNDDITFEFPKNVKWYDFRSLKLVEDNIVKYDQGRTAVFLRAGGIIPKKTRIRKSSGFMFWDPFTLICAVDDQDKSVGELYVDDGESFDFANGDLIHTRILFDGKIFSSTLQHGSVESTFFKKYDVEIERIDITGLTKFPNKILDKEGNEKEFSVHDGILTIHRAKLFVRDDWVLLFE